MFIRFTLIRFLEFKVFSIEFDLLNLYDVQPWLKGYSN